MATHPVGDSTYRIPPTDVQATAVRFVVLGIPGLVLLAYFILAHLAGINWSKAIEHALVFIPVFLAWFFVTAIPWSIYLAKRSRRIWNAHSYTWYRKTFPDNVTARGEVTCRHCGSHRTNVRNMMERTYMRCHSCSQCGETLYFSPEKT